MKSLISGLYLITDSDISGINHEEIVSLALKGGIRVVQLREKEMPKDEILKVALRLREITKRYGALLIINDYVDIAKHSDADGVHLGQEDLSIEEARRILGPDRIIGVSTHNLKEALEAQSRGSDYIGLGPIFPTETKETGPPIGTEIIRKVKENVNIPVVAIGGINLDNLFEVIESGADAVAIISAIAGSGDITETVIRFIEKIENTTRLIPLSPPLLKGD
jgi:thiamine-phosphate diphosphorylase